MDPVAAATRIGVVGAGHVGTTFAYSLLWSGLAAEILLVDQDRARAEGEAMDLSHAIAFTRPTRIRAAALEECEDMALVVFAAGTAQKPGETRLDLARRNTELVRRLAPELGRRNPGAVLLVATNPVDVLTYEACRCSGLPPARVIGSGTVLDTARFRYLLGRRYGVDPRNVHAFIVGEHGDSEVALWSRASVAGMPLHEKHDDIFRDTRDAAYQIIERKGATYYAVAAGLVRIVESILRDQHSVLTVSSLIEGPYGIRDVCLSLPAVLGRGGVERLLEPELSAEELAALRRSAEVLRRARG
jgi:L-lactate dehydrogenase